MTRGPSTLIRGGPIFDGDTLRDGLALRLDGPRVISVGADDGTPADDVIDLAGDLLAPAFVDLQVNGGGGVMLNDAPSVDTLEVMAEAHGRLGTGWLLPTLITDRPETTRAAIAATRAAIAEGVPGIAGLHLEGPHISLAKKGAHAADLIRPMTEADLETLCDAARSLPCLLVTLAPESATEAQVRHLAAAGARVALGHTEADYDTARAYLRAGATLATHLFNAMPGLAARAPGLAGAVLAEGGFSAGLIADGIHVHPAMIATALSAKTGPGRIFLVTDAMAPAGTDLPDFTLNGRRITRAQGRLTLEDGTLAGADLDLLTAIRLLVRETGTPLPQALAMATAIPAGVAGLPPGAGRIAPGTEARLLRIAPDLSRVAPLRTPRDPRP